MRTDSINKTHNGIEKNDSKSKISDTKSGFESVLKKEIKETTAENKLVKLGSLSKRNQTVSDLLIKNSDFKKDCWKIIHDKVNGDKAFNKIQSGAEIYLNTETKELVWGKALENENKLHLASPEKPIKAEPKLNPQISNAVKTIKPEPKLNPQISNAVKSYMGKDYKSMDCFELLVNGLKNMGVKYYGNGGLREKLIGMANSEGKSRYSYLNGEGIIKASGTEVFNKSIIGIERNYKRQAEKIYKEIEPHLSKDQILSFSTNSSGHTGIVSKNKENWTYINSGQLDNSINSETKIKGVGEETLKDEFYNWFKRAYNKKEGLTINLGRLNQMKLAVYGGASIKA